MSCAATTLTSPLTDFEHFAVLVMHAGNQLADRLSDYGAAVVRDNVELDDDSTPF